MLRQLPRPLQRSFDVAGSNPPKPHLHALRCVGLLGHRYASSARVLPWPRDWAPGDRADEGGTAHQSSISAGRASRPGTATELPQGGPLPARRLGLGLLERALFLEEAPEATSCDLDRCTRNELVLASGDRCVLP